MPESEMSVETFSVDMVGILSGFRREATSTFFSSRQAGRKNAAATKTTRNDNNARIS